MKFNALIDDSLISIARRSHRVPNNKLAELSGRGVLNSSFAVTDTFNVLGLKLKEELILLLDALSQTKLKSHNIKNLRSKINEFIVSEFNKHQEHLKNIGILDIGNINWDEYIQKELDDIKSSIELKLLLLERSCLDRKIKVWWDIGKILLTAIIGGMIGSYIKTIFEIKAP